MAETHIMVDLETWGTAPGSDLRSIGAVVFDPHAGTIGPKFYCNIRGGEDFGLVRDPDTVAWWADQSEAARAVLEKDQEHIADALVYFDHWWFAQQGGKATRDRYARFWANGSHFDFVLLEAAFRAVFNADGSEPYEELMPWSYRSPRDCKTAWDMAGGVDLPFVGTEHYALDDAIHQARCVIEAYRIIRETRNDG